MEAARALQKSPGRVRQRYQALIKQFLCQSGSSTTVIRVMVLVPAECVVKESKEKHNRDMRARRDRSDRYPGCRNRSPVLFPMKR
jgi:hypothetical protein